ncbi:PREDICTED: uncharacterized protein LOC109474247 [Branchiostoma belcheri]|uniref:Uncharacterized protein LOC109474247 n=1 Tax=Branchiostoma belcheri TaxID=7741 RepID=A0A6P4YKT6_BRABE|nr:PREDICTED: uncharacterized protein LOC109474247 [Branchiostoma belcheri]
MSEFTVAMVGKTGNGKSAVGNSILGQYGKLNGRAFETSFAFNSCTQTCEEKTEEVNGVCFHVIDTPGVMDTEADVATTLKEINNCRQLCPEGVNALLLVTRCDQKFTLEEEHAIRDLKILFGEKLLKYGIVIFTHGDEVERAIEDGEVTDLDEYLLTFQKSNALHDVLRSVDQRKVLFNNRARGNAADRQRDELVGYIRGIMANKRPYGIPEVSVFYIRYKVNTCFPATSTVLIDGKHRSKMASLQVGTKVVSVGQEDTARAQLDTVYFFSHAAEDVLAPFIRITTAGGKTLHLSEGHYIYVGKDAMKTGALFTAREVKVGDVVHVVDALDQAPRAEEVIEVKTEIKRGLYCPHTLGGSLVVDGVCVSTYTEMFPPRVAHGLLWPVRVLYRMAPNLAAKIAQPQGDQGMPKWLGWLYDYVA